MEREQYQEIPDINLNNQTNINQVTHDITLVQPPSTRVPGEIDKSQINKAKKLAFQIVIETLKTCSFERTFEKELKLKLKNLKNKDFVKQIEKYIKVLNKKFYEDLERYEQILNSGKPYVSSFWKEKRKDLYSIANITPDNNFNSLIKELDKLEIETLNKIKISSLQNKLINSSWFCNRSRIKKLIIITSLLGIADFLTFITTACLQNSKDLSDEEFERYGNIFIASYVALFPILFLSCIIACMSSCTDFEDISDFDNLIDKINETMENFVDPNAVPDENKGPEISEIV